MVRTLNPRSLIISWQPPPPSDHNGELTGYMVQYTRVGSNTTHEVFTADTTITVSMLSGVYANYSVKVAAVNTNGTGSYGNPVVQMSGQGCK